MASPFGPAVLIINPRAGRGRVGQQLPTIERTLRDHGLEYRIVRTSGAGDATEEARRALESGERFIVAVGGDGTVHEVVNGMVVDDKPVAPAAVLGVIAAGSGCDFVKTFGLPGDTTEAVRHLIGDNVASLDVVKLTYRDDGRQATRYVPNIAEVGLGGAVVERAARLPRRLGRAIYFVAFWLSIPRFKPTIVEVRADTRSFRGRAHNVVVANCQFYGGGMQISPRSWPTDGVLEVLVFNGPKSDAFTILPRVYRGQHLPHKNIVDFRASQVEIESEYPFPIEADGEALGTTPATFEVLPQLLRMKL